MSEIKRPTGEDVLGLTNWKRWADYLESQLKKKEQHLNSYKRRVKDLIMELQGYGWDETKEHE